MVYISYGTWMKLFPSIVPSRCQVGVLHRSLGVSSFRALARWRPKKVLGLDNRTFAKRWYCSKNRGYCTRKVQWIETPSCETGHLGGIHTEFSDHCNIFLETNSYCILETIGTPFGKKIQKNGIFPAGSQPSPLSLTSRSHRRISWNTGVSSSPNSVVYPIYKYGLSMLIIVIIPVTKKPVPKKMLKSCVYQCFHSGFRLYMMFQNHFSPGFPTCLLHFGAHDSGGSSTRAAEVPLFADRRQVEVRSRRQVKLRGGGAPRLTGDLVVSWNGGTPKSSISMTFSIVNHPFWATPMTMETLISWDLRWFRGVLNMGRPQNQRF